MIKKIISIGLCVVIAILMKLSKNLYENLVEAKLILTKLANKSMI